MPTIRLLAAGALAASLTLGFTAAPAEAKAPRACREAIREADEIIRIQTGVSTATGEMFTEFKAASDVAIASGSSISAVTRFINSMASAVRTLTGVVNAATAEVTPHVAAYSAAKARCR